MSLLRKRIFVQAVNLDTSPTAVFGVTVQCLARIFDAISQKLGSLAQEFMMLLELAESYCGSGCQVVTDGKQLLDRVNKADVQLLRVIRSFEIQSQYLASVYSRLQRSVSQSLNDSSELFFSLQQALERERTLLITKATAALNHISGFQGFLVWEDRAASTTVRRFLGGCTSSQRQKGATRAEICFHARVKTVECQALEAPILRCPKAVWTTTCANVSHADHAFSNSARCLSNLHNLGQCLLYLKLHLSSLSTLLSDYLSQLRTKLQVYSSAKETSEMFRLRLPSDECLCSEFEQMARLASEIECEGRNVSTYIERLPEQLATCGKMCLGVDCDQQVIAIVRESRIRALATACGKVNTEVAELLTEGGTVERLKKVMRKQGSEVVSDAPESAVPPVPSTDNIQTFVRVITQSVSIRPLYRFFHLKSEVLRQYQPHQLAKDLLQCRARVETELLSAEDNRDRAQQVAELTTRSFKIAEFENKVRASSQNEGLHSYCSSWDLESDPQPSPAMTRQDTGSILTEKDPALWAESSLSCSVESLKDLVQGSDDADKKYEIKGLKKAYYPLDQIPDKLSLIRVTLNRQTRDLYKSGVQGWKQSLKTLGASEKRLQRAISGATDTPWQDTISPVPDSESIVSVGSNLFTHSQISRSNTPHRVTSESEYSSHLRASKSTIRQSLRAGWEESAIGQRSAQTAALKMSRSKNLTQMIRSTVKGQKLEEDIERELNRLAPKVDVNVGRQMSATIHHATHYLKHRIDLVQRDRSLSPFDKIRSVRSEFHRYYTTMRRPKTAVRSRPI